ncbi:MAG: hypothetical protein JXA20_18120 [Spirochaetes bacterium]|nr:hypothetical protein [Spirochaetota bacterium]
MRRQIILLPLISAILVVCLGTARVDAMTISGGAVAFYSWWSPSFENMIRGNFGPAGVAGSSKTVSHNSDFSMKPSFLLGPSLSITLPAGFSISTVFLWGNWFHGAGGFYQSDFTTSNYNRYLFETGKWDLDVLVNYAVNRYLKLFGGIKYQGYSYDYTISVVRVYPSVAPFLHCLPECTRAAGGPVSA